MLVVSLRIGELRQVIPDSLAFYWDIVTRETPAEGARLEQVVVPARLRCGAARTSGTGSRCSAARVRRRGWR